MPTGSAGFGATWRERAKRAAALGLARLSVQPAFQRIVLGAIVFVVLAILLVVLVPLFVVGVVITLVASALGSLARWTRRALRRDGEGRRNVRVIRRE